MTGGKKQWVSLGPPQPCSSRQMSYQAADTCPTSHLAWPKHSSVQPFPGGQGFTITIHSRWLRLLASRNCRQRPTLHLQNYLCSNLLRKQALKHDSASERHCKAQKLSHTGEHRETADQPSLLPGPGGAGSAGGSARASPRGRDRTGSGKKPRRNSATPSASANRQPAAKAPERSRNRILPALRPAPRPLPASSAPPPFGQSATTAPARPALLLASSQRLSSPQPEVEPRTGEGGMSQQTPRRGPGRRCGVVAVMGLVWKLWFRASRGDFALSCTKRHQAEQEGNFEVSLNVLGEWNFLLSS